MKNLKSSKRSAWVAATAFAATATFHSSLYAATLADVTFDLRVHGTGAKDRRRCQA